MPNEQGDEDKVHVCIATRLVRNKVSAIARVAIWLK